MAESQLTVHGIQGVTVVDFRAPAMLDSSIIEAVAAELYCLVDAKATKRILLDFQKVRFLASQGVGVLITLKKKADAIGGQVAICGMRDEIRRVFKIMNLQKLFAFYDSEKDALAAWDIYTA